MDLFKPLLTDKRLHPLFKIITADEHYHPAMDVINQWAIGLSERKQEANKFIKEFQTTFNSSLWELYLNKAFKDLNFEIDYSKESPDFHLTHKSGEIVNVEAVTSNNPKNESKEYYSSRSLKDSFALNNDDFLDQSTIKLIGKIKDKRDLFLGKQNKKHPYCTLEHVKGNPFVIAIAPFDNHLSYAQNNTAMNRVLYGIEPPKMNSRGQMVVEKKHHILNRNNKKIDLGIFTNDSYKEIGAVIFSTTGMFGKAVVQTGISNFIRATRYRQMSIADFMTKEGREMLGKSHQQINKGYDVVSMRFVDGDHVCGSDRYLYDSVYHIESHLDGLHIYYNPYAEIPIGRDLFCAYEITQNSYDIEAKEMICRHNDGSLVSRQTFS